VFAKEQLVSALPSGAKTMFENFKIGVQKKAEGNCLGKRVMSSDTQHTFLWESYSSVFDRVTDFGSGLLQAHGITKGAVVGILSISCPEWVIAEQACYGYGYVTSLFTTSVCLSLTLNLAPPFL